MLENSYTSLFSILKNEYKVSFIFFLDIKI